MFMLDFSAMATELWDLDTRHLAALLAIARTRSISRAAIELGYGQSAVSQQLASLERIVGTRLVDRGVGPRPVTLTAAGQALIPHAQWIVQRLEAARRELRDLDDGHAGHLTIGSFQSASARLLPRILSTYRQAWPNVTVTIHSEDLAPRSIDLLQDGTFDLTFIEGAVDDPSLSAHKLLDDRFVVVVPPDHRLARRRVISLSDLAGEPLVSGFAEEPGAARVDAELRAAGVVAQTAFRSDDNTARQRMVHAGLGCAVMADLTVERELVEGGVPIALKEKIVRTISIVWSADRTLSPAARRFLDAATAAFGGGRASPSAGNGS